MARSLLLLPLLLIAVGCNPETATSPTVRQQKAIYRAAFGGSYGSSRAGYKKLDQDIAKVRRDRFFTTDGQALLYMIDQFMVQHASVSTMLSAEFSKLSAGTGIVPDPQSERAQLQEEAAQLRAWQVAREAIASLEGAP